MTEKVWRIEYDNTSHPDGDGGSFFEQWWTVTDGKRSFRAEYQDDAELLAAALNAYAPPLPDNAGDKPPQVGLD